MTISNIFKRNKYYIIFILAYVVITVSPLLNGGFYSDDRTNSSLRGAFIVNGRQVNLSSVCYANYTIFKQWVTNVGRFYPLAYLAPGYLIYYLFYSQDNVIILNILKIVFLCTNILLYGYLIWLTTKSEILSLLSMLVIPIFYQFRLYHDPILSFPFLLYLIFFYALLSLILLQQYIVKAKKSYLVLSLFLFLAGCLTYEISYLFFILHFILIYFQRNNLKTAIKQTIPFFIIVVILGLLTLYLRHNISGIPSTYAPNLDLRLYFKTLAKQTLSSLPLSSIIFNRFRHVTDIKVNNILIINAISCTLFIVLFYKLFSKLSLKSEEPRFLIIFGSALSVIPALMIAASPKFQHEVTIRNGYLPVYIQYHGILLLLTGAFLWLSKSLHINITKHFKYILIIILTIVNFINIQNNAEVIEIYNGYLGMLNGSSGMLFEHALQDDILAKVPDGAVIITMEDITPEYFYTHMPNRKTRYQFHSIEEYNSGKLQYADLNKFILENKLYIIRYTPGNPPKGYFLLGKVISLDSTTEYKFIFSDSKIFTTISKSSEDYVLVGASIIRNTDEKSVVKYNKIPMNKITCRKMDSKYCLIDDPIIHADYISLDLSRETISGTGTQKTQTLIYLDNNFTIELSVKPKIKQVPYADIISNHPGFYDHEGFAIENTDPVNPNNNVYGFGIGNGHEWTGYAKFALKVNRWNHIVIVNENNKITAYLNGETISQKDIVDNIKNSNMPLIIGNWFRGDRPFNGSIGKFNVLNVPLSANEVQLHYKALLSKM
ncbi:MAG: hypothetical protein HQK96_12555 [Nitrospirae bacterium]|nr:hypothetical protein [Nitrospirota bacterium]